MLLSNHHPARVVLETLAEAEGQLAREAQLQSFILYHQSAQEHEGEQYDKHRTQAEVDLAETAADMGIIPDVRSDGPKPINFYGLKCMIEEWSRSFGQSEDALRERLDHLQEQDNPWSSTTDGSAGQWRAWNRYCQEAVQWLLGEHEDQEDPDDDT